MKRSILSLSAITALSLVLSSATALGQQRSLKEQLVGTWTLVSLEQVRPDGSKHQNYGSNPKGVHVFAPNGVHVFAPNGRFYLMFARDDLPKIASNNRMKGTAEEHKAIWEGSIAYFGTYTVDEADKTVSLTLEASTFPNQLAAPQKRIITSLTSDELKYTNATASGGSQNHLVFKRAE
jgi:Lipocalin-like domain